MVSLTSHLRVIFRPLVFISIIVLLFVFLFNLNLSSYRPDNSISYAAQLDLLVKTPQVPQVEKVMTQSFTLSEIKVTQTEISPSTTLAPSHSSNDVEKKVKELCPLVSPKLIGWTNITSEMKEALLKEDETTVESKMKEAGLKIGGKYEPEDCQSRHKVAIVVPLRNRTEHLTVFLRYLHPVLQRQQLNYVIIVVEQSDGSPFNRGMLMNIGFKEAQLQDTFQCFIFHDVDFLPEDDGNPYTCPENGKPRQMSFSIDYWGNYKPTPASHFGGVTALSAADFQKVNGYSNSFWGWGGEDDQMFQRVRFNNLTVVRAFDDQPSLIHKARYTTLSHQKATPNPGRMQVIKEGSKRFKTDGLVDLQYQRLNLEFKFLYTRVLVNIQPPLNASSSLN